LLPKLNFVSLRSEAVNIQPTTLIDSGILLKKTRIRKKDCKNMAWEAVVCRARPVVVAKMTDSRSNVTV
jgi:hypothetical protein